MGAGLLPLPASGLAPLSFPVGDWPVRPRGHCPGCCPQGAEGGRVLRPRGAQLGPAGPASGLSRPPRRRHSKAGQVVGRGLQQTDFVSVCFCNTFL